MFPGRYDVAAYSAFIFYSMSSLVIPVVLVAMGRELHFPLDDGGMSYGGILHLVRSAAMVLSLLSCGIIAGKSGKRLPMGWGVFAIGVSIFLCGCAPGYWFLLPLLLAAGLGEGICEGLATPFVQALHPDNPEKYVNIAHSFWSVGIGICVLGAGAMLSCGVSWRIILAVTGTGTVAASLLFLCRDSRRHPYPEQREKSDFNKVWQNSKSIFKYPRFWLYCAGMFMGAGAEFCLTFWAAVFLQLTFGATPFAAGTGTAAIALGMFAGRNIFARIATEKNLRKILISSSLCTIPLTLLLAWIKADMFPSDSVMYATLMSILFLCGIGISPYWPTLQVHGVNRMRKEDSTLLYIYFSAMGIPGCGFFTWIIGVLGDKFTLQKAFYLLPVTLLIYAGIILADRFVKNEPAATEGEV